MSRPRSRPGRGAAALAGLAALAAGAVAPASASAATDSPVLSATVTPARLSIGAPATVSGRLSVGAAVLAGATLILQSEAYPFHGFASVASTSTAADGSFAFAAIRPERNTRLRVLLEAQVAASSALLALTVDPAVSLAARGLGPGRTRLSMRVRHATVGPSAPVSAEWFVQAHGSRVFKLAAVTRTREPSAGLLYASAFVDPPSRRFAYRVCINPAWELAMGPSASHGACPQHDFLLDGGRGA